MPLIENNVTSDTNEQFAACVLMWLDRSGSNKSEIHVMIMLQYPKCDSARHGNRLASGSPVRRCHMQLVARIFPMRIWNFQSFDTLTFRKVQRVINFGTSLLSDLAMFCVGYLWYRTFESPFTLRKRVSDTLLRRTLDQNSLIIQHCSMTACTLQP